ncbi:hypothetical protein [Azospirillum sp.]|uniref:hypothetical protein n=1 Tax=Azospirillum sp. TaxID=34012 RepID=UPI003D740E26
MIEQRTVVVPTRIVDGIIRLNREMGQKVVSRYDTGGQMSDCETVLVFEGEPASLDRDRFIMANVAQYRADDTTLYDCDGHRYYAHASQSISEVVSKDRASRAESGVVTLAEAETKHTAWKRDPDAATRAEAAEIPF